MTSLLPSPELQFCDANGKPYAGGSLGMYVPGTLSPKTTWSDAAGTVQNSNPIVLDSAGRCVVFGSGDYRAVLKDSAGNLVWDQQTSSALSESAISAVMLPVVGATSLRSARDLMGITAAIATAVANIQLLPGAAGATGPTGPQGVAGPVGPAGQSAASNSSFTNPGYWQDASSGLIFNFGSTLTWVSASFAKPYSNACLGVYCTTWRPRTWLNAASVTNYGFTPQQWSPDYSGDWSSPHGVDTCYWLAVGY